MSINAPESGPPELRSYLRFFLLGWGDLNSRPSVPQSPVTTARQISLVEGKSDRFEFSIQLLDVLSTEETIDSVRMVVVHTDGVVNLFPLDRGMEKSQF